MPSIEQLEAFLEKDPDEVFINFGLAMELVKAGRHDDALARFDRVMALDAEYHAAYFHKANTLIGLSRMEEARDLLSRGVAVTQNAGDAHAESEMRELLASLGG